MIGRFTLPVMAGQKAQSAVFAPEVPAIDVFVATLKKTWTPGTGPGVTVVGEV